MANKALEGKSTALPEELLQFLQGKMRQGSMGAKRIAHMLSDQELNYGEMKRIKHDIEHVYGDTMEWAPLYDFVCKTLDRWRKEIEQGQDNRSMAGDSEAYRKGDSTFSVTSAPAAAPAYQTALSETISKIKYLINYRK